MITGADGFDLHVRWRFPSGREYIFACIALFVFLFVIYSNSFQGVFVFDDAHNIVENRHIHLKSLDWNSIKQTFYGIEGRKISRPVSYFTLALNYYFHGLDVFGYHMVNFIIHYLTAVFLFLFIYNTLRLPSLRERYGPTASSIALLAALFWATSPLQVTAVTYIVQRMASMAGLFYIMAMYLYLKGRTAEGNRSRAVLWGLCLLSGVLAAGSKENAVLLPFGIWLFDLLLIQGASRENVIRNLKVFVPVALVVGALGLWYANIGAILSGAAYENRPFTLVERLLTQPRIVIWYISLLFYPLASRLTLIHDIEWSTSLLAPWTTMPAMALILGLVVLALYLARRRPLISFAILFYFLNHIVESTFIPLVMIFEHRNYIPSLFFYVPAAIAIVGVLDYFSYKKAIQFAAVVVFVFLMFAQGSVTRERNALFAHPILLWTDNVIKTPTRSEPYNDLGLAYADSGRRDLAHEFYSLALSIDRQDDLRLRSVYSRNLGLYYMTVEKDYEKAMDSFHLALTAYPRHGITYSAIAECFIRKGDPGGARVWIDEALPLFPASVDLRHVHGLALLKEGEYRGAIDVMLGVLALDPNRYSALNILGEAYRALGNTRLATVYWESYRERFPRDLQAILALIELYHSQGRKEDLTKTIGTLVILKGSLGWAELMEHYRGQERVAAYVPADPDKLHAILREFLD